MDKKKLLFIFNPKSGKGQIRNQLMAIVDTFVKSGYEVTIYPTQAKADAVRKVAEAADEYDLVVCSGGDGTLDEVVTGMMQCDGIVPIGYIPAGSTNDFAQSLKIPKNMLQAADMAVNGQAFPCDVGVFNEDYFVYIAAFGLFTDVSYMTNQKLKNIFGHVAYILESAKRLYDIPSYYLEVEVNGKTIRDEFIYGMITNSVSVGGMKNMTGSNVKLDDGEFEVTLIKTPKNPIALQEIITALLISQFDTKYMYSFRAKKITFESEESISWTLDGEFGGDNDHVYIENCKQELDIVVPEKYIDSISEQRMEEQKKNGKRHLAFEKFVDDMMKEKSERENK